MPKENANKGKKKGGTRSSIFELEKRIKNVIEWYLDGQDTEAIVSSCVSAWGVTERQSHNYLKRAREKIKESSASDIPERIAWHIAARLKLYYGIQDKNTAQAAATGLKILDSLAELENIKEKPGKPSDSGGAGATIHDITIETTLNLS